MKRRQFGAALATATLSLGGIGGAAAETSAQETDPLRIEDVSVSLKGVTMNVGRATFAFEDGTMRFRIRDVTMESETLSTSIGTLRVSADGVDAETFATLRAALVEAFEGQTLSPLLTALAEVDVDPDAEVRVFVESVEMDGQLVADQITATGTVDSVVPEGTRALLQNGVTLEELAALGPSEWSQLTVQRGDAEFVANDVVIELDGGTLSITSPGGEATVSGRTFEFSEMALDVLPPETIPAAHVEFASEVRQLIAEGNLSLSAVSSAADESGVTVENTSEAIRNARFELSFAEVTEDGETVVANFVTSGTLAELAEVLRQQV